MKFILGLALLLILLIINSRENKKKRWERIKAQHETNKKNVNTEHKLKTKDFTINGQSYNEWMKIVDKEIEASNKYEALGLQGELEIIEKIYSDCNLDMKIIHNAYIPKDEYEGTTEIDVIIITNSGIYVIESKNYSGWIFGSEYDNQWTRSTYNFKSKKSEKLQFYNPIMQNENHIYFLNKLLNLEKQTFHSIIVFGNSSELKKIRTNTTVLHFTELHYLLKMIKENKQILNDEQVNSIYNKLMKFTNVTQEIKDKHNEAIIDYLEK